MWRLSIKSEGAYSINLVFDVYSLAPGAKLWVYKADGSSSIGAFTSFNNKDHGKFATVPVPDAEIVLELYEPAEMIGMSTISVSRVVHAYREFQDSKPCNINVMCSDIDELPYHDVWADTTRRSVAMILLDQNTRLASGALINNAANFDRQYFLNAKHVYEDESDLETMIFAFNYESSSCYDGSVAYFNESVQGAILIADHSSTDVALFELLELIPEYYNVYYAGWTRWGSFQGPVAGIHHPRGDIKKISYCEDAALIQDWSGNGNFYSVPFSFGVTEPGSSGSPAFTNNGLIFGQLLGTPDNDEQCIRCGSNQMVITINSIDTNMVLDFELKALWRDEVLWSETYTAPVSRTIHPPDFTHGPHQFSFSSSGEFSVTIEYDDQTQSIPIHQGWHIEEITIPYTSSEGVALYGSFAESWFLSYELQNALDPLNEDPWQVYGRDPQQWGCTDGGAVEWSPYPGYPACNYDPGVIQGNISYCEYESCIGCMEIEALNYDPIAQIPCSDCCEYFMIRFVNADEAENDLGGWLKITDVSDSVPSNSFVQLAVNADYSIRTREEFRVDSTKKHHRWNNNQTEYWLMHNRQFTIAENGTRDMAVFKDILNVAVPRPDFCSLEVQDPWLVRPDGIQTGTDWVTLTSSQYPVFLNQGNIYDPDSDEPIYSLRAPLMVEDDGQWKIFSQWSGDSVTFPGGADTTSNRETPVVFNVEGATATAQYYSLSVSAPEYGATVFTQGETVYLQALASSFDENTFTKVIPIPSDSVDVVDEGQWDGYRRYRLIMRGNGSVILNYVPIQEGEGVFVTSAMPQIPPGTVTNMPPRSKLVLYDPTRISGTPDEPITFQKAGTEEWDGIQLETNGELSHVIIKNARNALRLHGNGKSPTVRHSQFLQCDTVIKVGDYNHFTGAPPNLTFTSNQVTFSPILLHEGFREGVEPFYSYSVKIDSCTIKNANMVKFVADYTFWESPELGLFDNIIVNSAYSLDYLKYGDQLSTLLINNIFSDCYIGLNNAVINTPYYTSIQFNMFANCIFYYGIIPDTTQGAENVFRGDAGFIDPENGNYKLKWNSPCIDRGRSGPTYYDPDGTRNDIGPNYSPQFAGTISDDQVVEYEGAVKSSATFPSGTTLTLKPGAKLIFYPGVYLTMRGDLNAVGTSSNPISVGPSDPQTTNTQFHHGFMNYSNNVQVDYLEVYNSQFGLYINRSSGTVSHVTLEQDHYGLYLYAPNLTLVSDMDITNCSNIGLYVNTTSPKLDIMNSRISNNKYGVSLYNYSGRISGNTVTDNQYDGISFYSQSTGDMTTWRTLSDLAENNHIDGNGRHGLNIYTGSFPLVGAYMTKGSRLYGGFNYLSKGSGQSIVYNHNSGTIDARVNWWTSGSLIGPFSIFPDVNEAIGMGKSTTGTENDPTYEQLYYAHTTFVDSLYSEALTLYAAIIDDHPNDSLGVEALGGAIACYNTVADEAGFAAFLMEKSDQYPGTLVGISARDYLTNLKIRSMDFAQALALNNEVLLAYENFENSAEALANGWFKQAMINEELANQANGLGKATAAGRYRIKSAEITATILDQYGTTDVANLVRILHGEEEQPRGSGPVLPVEFALHPAYPNPFNPITTIRYDLPEAARVRVAVYDIRGRHVTMLTNEAKQPGSYQLQWKGKDALGRMVASGLYFYTLEAVAAGSNQTFRASRKMLLMK